MTFFDADTPLVTAADPPPFDRVNRSGAAPLLLVCDHASNAVPARLDRLGLSEDDLTGHIAWDIGAAEVTRRLALSLDAQAVLAGHSRLVIDPNRQPGAPDSIPEVSDGIAIPGNKGLTDAQAHRRVTDVFRPYHDAISDAAEALWRRGPAPALVSIHSFTPTMNGRPRPWHVGVLWNRDPRMAVPLLERLRREPELTVGDNQPYSGQLIAYTLDTHASAAGLPHVAIELRQDLVSTEEHCAKWARILAECLTPVLAMDRLHDPRIY